MPASAGYVIQFGAVVPAQPRTTPPTPVPELDYSTGYSTGVQAGLQSGTQRWSAGGYPMGARPHPMGAPGRTPLMDLMDLMVAHGGAWMVGGL